MGTWRKSLIFALLLLVITNLLYLDIILFFSPTASITSLSMLSPPEVISPFPTASVGKPDSCPESCLALIHQATESLTLAEPVGRGGLPPSPALQKATPQSLVREFFIPLGSGKTTSRDWEDLTGTDTIIDTTKYGTIKEAYFEANIFVPTGNGSVTAMLYNVTDKHPAWFAEVSTESRKPILLRSPQIVLNGGGKVYRVRLKSSLGAEAVMDFARIKIMVE